MMKKLILLFAGSILCFISCKTSETSEANRHGRERLGKEELFAKFDANKDGKLAKDEVKGPLLTDFSKIDTNQDGFISKDEIENIPKPERTGPPGGGQGGQGGQRR